MEMAAVVLRLLALAMLAGLCAAKPRYYTSPGLKPGGPTVKPACTAHPTTRLGSATPIPGYHLKPIADLTSKLTLSTTGAPNPTSLCLGKTYTLKLTFGQAREALLTATIGKLAQTTYKSFTNFWTKPDTCAGKRILLEMPDPKKPLTLKATGFSTTYVASQAGSVTFQVTSALAKNSAFQTFKKTYTVANCPAGK